MGFCAARCATLHHMLLARLPFDVVPPPTTLADSSGGSSSNTGVIVAIVAAVAVVLVVAGLLMRRRSRTAGRVGSRRDGEARRRPHIRLVGSRGTRRR